MIALADAEHHGVGDLAGDLVAHEIVNRPEVFALPVTHCRADDFVGGDEAVRFSVATGPPAM